MVKSLMQGQSGNYGFQGQHGQAPPPKKGMSGCLIAVLVLAGVVLIGVVLAGVGVWRVMQNPDAQKMVKAVGDTAKLAEEARKAPGTGELRKAGCRDALVLDPKKVAEIMKAFEDAGASRPGGLLSVMCEVGSKSSAPECDALAKVYVAAGHPTTDFRLTIQVQGTKASVCEEEYASDGKPSR
jgi:hypothetical protein